MAESLTLAPSRPYVARLMRKCALYLALPILILHFPQPAEAVDVFGFKFFEKKKPAASVAPTTADEAVAKGDLKRVDELIASNELSDALKLARTIVAQRGQTSAAARAQFMIGQILERKQDYEDAFKAYSDYLTNYPRGGDFDNTVKAQFDIAKMYMEGRKKKVLGVTVATSYGKAETMFADIVRRAPFHRLAPLAQFNVGQVLERQGKGVNKVPSRIRSVRTAMAASSDQASIPKAASHTNRPSQPVWSASSARASCWVAEPPGNTNPKRIKRWSLLP